MSGGTVNVDSIHLQLDAINAEILDLLDRAKGLDADLSETVTDEMMAAKRLVIGQPGRPVQIENGTGRVLDQGQMEGAIGPLTDDQYKALKDRTGILARLVKVLDQPTGTGANAKSFAQLLRAGGVRLRRGVR